MIYFMMLNIYRHRRMKTLHLQISYSGGSVVFCLLKVLLYEVFPARQCQDFVTQTSTDSRDNVLFQVVQQFSS
jgi:hypothetical protein